MDELTILSLPKTLAKARYVVMYDNKNITNDLAEYLISIRYTNHLADNSDELEVTLEDVDGRWRSEWYPAHGDTLSLSIGWENEQLVSCGRFQIDEIEFTGSPTTISIRALATGINNSVRTHQNKAYEKITLDKIALQVAQRQGFKLVGKIEPIPLERQTQNESDLVFLSKLASQYDYSFKIVDDTMFFHCITELAYAAPIGRIQFADLKPGWRIRDQLKEVPKNVVIKSQNPSTGKLVSYEMQNGEAVKAPSSSVSKASTSADTTKMNTKTATGPEAQAKARAELAKKNRERTQGQFSIQGRPRLYAGCVIGFDGAGLLSGEYLITTCTHSISTNGYETEVTICRIRTEDKVAELKLSQNKPRGSKGGLAVYGMESGDAVKVN